MTIILEPTYNSSIFKQPGTNVTINLEVTIIQNASLARATFGHTHDVSQSMNVSAGDLRVVLVLGLAANSWFFLFSTS